MRTSLIALLLVVGCSSSSPCQDAMKTMCDKSCACPAADGMCHIVIQLGPSSTFEFSFDHNACYQEAVSACSDPKAATINFDECNMLLQNAPCTAIPVFASDPDAGQALATPVSCVQGPADAGVFD
jgi:hypothetical protein